MAKGTSSADRTEEAVRQYLTYLKTPDALIDQDRVERAQQRVDRFTNGDPVEHLKALAALERAQAVDEAPLRAAFVDALPGWAEENQISVELLRGFGVPDEVLVEAKLLSRKRADRERAAARRPAAKKAAPLPATVEAQAEKPEPTAPAAGANGHGRLSPEEVAELLDGVPVRGTAFTVAELAEETGITKDAARAKVRRCVEAKLLKDVGVDESPGLIGKRPRLYERTS